MQQNTEYEQGYRDGLTFADEVALSLEARWRASAAKYREDGTFNTGWPFHKTFVAHGYKRAAETIDAAVRGIEAIRGVLRAAKSKGHSAGQSSNQEK